MIGIRYPRTRSWAFATSVCAAFLASGQDTTRTDLRWFQDAKLGIFIHWGIYSVQGVDESWAFYNKKMTHADYMKQLGGFTAKNYDPSAWADLIQRSGAKYAVITTKHHDGVAMWDARSDMRTGAVPVRLGDVSYWLDGFRSPNSIVNGSPVKHDLIVPLFANMRDRGVKCGAYFSLIDWSREDYPRVTKDSTRYRIKDDPARWQSFRTYYQGQVTEIATQLKPDLWWFDGDWEHSAEEWEAAKVRAMILEKNPKAIINGRLAGFGDYATPEQNIPIETPKAPAWELCMTLGEQWGWQPYDTNYKSTRDLIHIFADVIGHGGNLLLGIGPKEDGTFTPGQVSRLEDLGQWTSKHAEAIYGTRAGLPNGHFFGPTTLSPDSTTLYLFLANGMRGSVEIKGLDNKILSAEVVGPGMALTHRVVGKISWSKVPGLVFIDVPEEQCDEWMTVVKVKLDGPVKLYRGEGGY
ncbi:MAG: alpha-L-fucosidase [Flavobacteriales bacterium]|nr:alpha-L-fucosidase [Flavobacteriales bacterium]